MKRKPVTIAVAIAMMLAFLLVPSSVIAAPDYVWTSIGGGPANLFCGELAYDSARDILYAGCRTTGGAGMGLWRCDDATGVPVWTNISSGANIGNRFPTSLTYDAASNTLFAGISFEGGTTGGVWRCTNPDTAHTWTKICAAADIATYSIVCLAYDDSRDILYAGSFEDQIGGTGHGIWRCANARGAFVWTQMTGAGGTTPIGSLLYDAQNNLLYDGAYTGGVTSYANPNNSVTPTNIGPGGGTTVSMALDSSRHILYIGQIGGGVSRCMNPEQPGGQSWTKISTDSDIGSGSIYGLALDAGRDKLFAGSVATWGSTVTGVWSLSGAHFSTNWQNSNGDVAGLGISSLAEASGPAKLFAGTRTVGVWSADIPMSSVWYLAEGTTAWGFETYISVMNPNIVGVNVSVTYMTPAGQVDGPAFVMPPSSQTTIFPRETLGDVDFSTRVECTDNYDISVDRTMSWTGEGALSPEGHSSVGVTAPATQWYLPEGSSNWGFESFILVQNPNPVAANCTLTYMIEGVGPQDVVHQVGANSRATFNMFWDVGTVDASVRVTSDQPVIPERAMYRNNRREGHESIGTTTAATDYFLAEGTTAWGFTTFVLVQNPNATPTDVTLTYMTNSGAQVQPAFQMPAESRQTVRVNAALPEQDCSIQVHGSQPIIAERAMYWDYGMGEACHDSIGMPGAHITFYLPDGETSTQAGGRETFILVQNPNASEVAVEITYLTANGTGNQTVTDTIPANSRRTYPMVGQIQNQRAAILVNCTTPGMRIMCERAMYWNARGAGTDTIGGYSD